jgi:hypothetical protein
MITPPARYGLGSELSPNSLSRILTDPIGWLSLKVCISSPLPVIKPLLCNMLLKIGYSLYEGNLNNLIESLKLGC